MEYLNKRTKAITLVTGIEEVENEEGKIEQRLVKKEYAYPIFAKGSITKKAISLGVKMDNQYKEGTLSADFIDELADFAVELYQKKFKRNEIIDGIDATSLLTVLIDILYMVLDGEQQDSDTKKFIEEKSR